MTKSNNPEAAEKKNPSHQCGVGQGAHDAGKDDSETSTLRTDSLPKPEKVRELPLEDKENKAGKHAATQNQSDGKGEAGLNQQPVSRTRPTTTSSGN